MNRGPAQQNKSCVWGPLVSLRCLWAALLGLCRMLAFHFHRLWCMFLTAPSFRLPFSLTVGPTVKGDHALKGPHAVFIPKPKEQLAKDKSGYSKFWNTEHCKVLQFLPHASKKRRNIVVDARWKMLQTPLLSARDFTKQKGFNARVRATCDLSSGGAVVHSKIQFTPT
jgi:hypothetical protein